MHPGELPGDGSACDSSPQRREQSTSVSKKHTHHSYRLPPGGLCPQTLTSYPCTSLSDRSRHEGIFLQLTPPTLNYYSSLLAFTYSLAPTTDPPHFQFRQADFLCQAPFAALMGRPTLKGFL